MENRMNFETEVPSEMTEHLSLLYKTASLFNSSLDVEKVLNMVIDMIIEVFEGERGFVMLYDKEEKELKIVVARNMEKENIGERDFSISMTVANKVFNTAESILSTNATLDPGIRSKSILLNEIRSILCVPMKLKDEIIGVIYTDNRLREGTFDKNEKTLLLALADQAATAIENARLYKQVSDNLEKIKDLERVKGEFISLLSHELRTPLVPIRGYVYTLRHFSDQLPEDERIEALDTIEGRVEHLGRLINDLLTVASIETDRSMRLYETNIDIKNLIKHNIDNIEKKYPSHSFTLNISHIPLFSGDQDKLSHAFYHILDNAAKFYPEGGEITVYGEKTPNGKEIHVYIEDHGIGIDEIHIDKIFDKFYQVDASTTRSFEGMGIGLYIVRYVIESHGGKITVESTPGKGSIFKVVLPLMERIME